MSVAQCCIDVVGLTGVMETDRRPPLTPTEEGRLCFVECDAADPKAI